MSIETTESSWQEQVAAAREAAQRSQPRFRHDRALVALTASLLLCLIVFIVGLALGVRGDDVWLLGLANLTFFVASISFAVNRGLANRDRHIFISLLSFIVMAGYVMPVFGRYLPSEWPVDATAMARSALERPDIIVGQLVVLLGFSVLFTSYALPLGRFLSNRLPKPRIDWPLPTIVLISLVMMAIGWPLRLAGGVGAIPKELGTGVLGTLVKGTIYCNAILTLAWIRHRSPVALSLLGMNLLLGGVVGLIHASKMEVLIRPLVVAVTWFLVRGTVRLRWIALGIVALSIVYPASTFLRGTSGPAALSRPLETLSSLASHASRSGWKEWFATGLGAAMARADSLGAASVLIRDTPRVSPFQHGATLKLFFVAFIPRILWPGKPQINIGGWITEVYGSGPGFAFNTAPSQIGEYYINFGILGVIGGMALVGTLIRLAHESLMWRGGTAASILALSVIIYYLTVGFDGSVGQCYSNVVFAIVPVAVVQILARALLPTYERRDGDESG